MEHRQDEIQQSADLLFVDVGGSESAILTIFKQGGEEIQYDDREQLTSPFYRCVGSWKDTINDCGAKRKNESVRSW